MLTVICLDTFREALSIKQTKSFLSTLLRTYEDPYYIKDYFSVNESGNQLSAVRELKKQ